MVPGVMTTDKDLILGRYRPGSVLAAWSRARVLTATDVTGGVPAVLTQLSHLTSAANERARRFAEAQASLIDLVHPNLPTVRVVGGDENGPVAVGDMLSVRSASVSGSGTLTIDAISFGLGVAAALHVLHAEGVVHGAVTPRSVIEVARGAGWSPVLVGAAAGLVDPTSTYSAPEVDESNPEPDPAVDVYGLGRLLESLLVTEDGPGGPVSLLPVGAGRRDVDKRMFDRLIDAMTALDPGARPDLDRVIDRLCDLGGRPAPDLAAHRLPLPGHTVAPNPPPPTVADSMVLGFESIDQSVLVGPPPPAVTTTGEMTAVVAATRSQSRLGEDDRGVVEPEPERSTAEFVQAAGTGHRHLRPSAQRLALVGAVIAAAVALGLGVMVTTGDRDAPESASAENLLAPRAAVEESASTPTAPTASSSYSSYSSTTTTTEAATTTAPVAGLTLSPDQLELTAGEGTRLLVRGRLSDGTSASVEQLSEATWASSDESVVEVEGAGRLTARSAGEATITVSLNGKQAVARVTVAPKPTTTIKPTTTTEEPTTTEADSTTEPSATDTTTSGSSSSSAGTSSTDGSSSTSSSSSTSTASTSTTAQTGSTPSSGG